jgi:hypothetical protein
MGYGLIPAIASIALAVHHVVLTEASRWSKGVVLAVVAVSFVIRDQYPQWLLAATLLQVAISIYMLIYLRIEYGAGR